MQGQICKHKTCDDAKYVGYIAYKRYFVNIISIIFITLIPHPGVRMYYQRAQSFLLKIFILFFYFSVL